MTSRLQFDKSGKIIRKQTLTKTNTLDLEDLKAGIYLFRFEGKGEAQVFRMIKR